MTEAVTVVELKSFAAAAKGLISASEVAELTVFLAMTPKAGDLIAGTGGVRKLRWRASGRGKRGGARVIYYYHNETVPIFLITAFAKNVRSNISKAERNQMKALTRALVVEFGEKP